MASNITTTAADSPVSRKRPAEDEALKAEELQPKGESAVAAPAADASAENGADDEGEQQPAKRARKEEEEEETKETESQENKEEEESKNKKEQKAEESGGGGKLAFLGPTGSGEGFSSFSSLAAGPLSFSSVSSGAADAGAAPLSFNLGAAGSTPGPFSIDFSSPTPFGSLFGGEGSKDGSAAATPSLTSTGFTLFSSSAPSTSSDFAFSLSSSSSSLLFSSGAESSSTSVAEKVEVVTGEENEERVHSVRAKLLKLEPESQAWKERGSGQLHLNVAKDHSYARLVMRAEGALRLILNTALFPHTITKRVQEKGVQVSAVEEGKPVLYLLRASRRDEAEELFAAINRHKELGGSSSSV
ncbi:RanBP1 domain containing protein [Acanthamoeba castellanii str. Neff]|uniref:RanBP1 domain containing protein n=1 Tax=Acanthamoeba castellanii (strain ATCC 30010 / Neff) TaxID=1257118 RepID=L8HE17_ACACF|nr:RanBP1 domain containing protein [Acanthamoeba castellanii str. Neff]ELR23440.1 RanBP1 domain containing protein [Acanthamoeba castellanii str. Neff]